ncbi:MAG TPA: hypothetical protein VNZ86_20420 [Bacteroidia bacterium]|nr:hypothetical protein [Bacteroidia bacterium]
MVIPLERNRILAGIDAIGVVTDLIRQKIVFKRVRLCSMGY